MLTYQSRLKLNKVFPEKYILANEYYEKYFIMKKIQSVFPRLKERSIYQAIEFANLVTEEPKRKKDFFSALLRKISELKE